MVIRPSVHSRRAPAAKALCLAVLLASSVLRPAFAGEEGKSLCPWYGGHVDVEGKVGSKRDIGETSAFIPVSCSPDAMLFSDLRFKGDSQGNREGNIGLGYRKVTTAPVLGEGIAGGVLWLDRKRSGVTDKFHSQAALGAEWLAERWEMRANGYVPLTGEAEAATGSSASVSDQFLSGTGIFAHETVQRQSLKEIPLHGVDAEVGFKIPGADFWMHMGGFSFSGDDAPSLDGVRSRATLQLTRNVALTAEGQYDDERGRQGWLGARLTLPFGGSGETPQGLKERMTVSPVRDVDIVTQEKVQSVNEDHIVPVLNADTGAAQQVLHVDNTAAGGGDGSAETPFNTLAAAQAASSAHGIIYMHTGDGTSAGQDQGLTLDKTGQRLIGAGTDFVYDSSRFTTASGARSNAMVLLAAGTAPVITNINAGGDGVTVTADDIRVAGVTVDGAARDGIAVVADGGAASARNVGIRDVTARNNRMGIYIHGANGGAVGASVEGAVVTSNAQHGIAVYDDTNGAFDVDLGGGSLGSAGLNVLAGNTLEDLAVDYDGRTLAASNNWWGQASGPDTDSPAAGIAPQIYYGAPINDGLAGHWTFDSEWTSNTTAYDRSGNGNDGVLSGGLSLADMTAGQNGEALYFNGAGHYVVVPNLDLSATDAVSALLWRHTADFSPFGIDLESSTDFNASTTGFVVLASDTTACAGKVFTGMQGAGGYNIECYQRPAVPAWHYYAPVFDKSQNSTNEVAMYVDGTPASFVNQTAVSDSVNNFGVNDLYMMSRGGIGLFADEYLDDVRVYARALSPTEMAELHRMNTASAVDTSGFLTAAP